MFELRQQKILKSRNLNIESLTDNEALELIESEESEKGRNLSMRINSLKI